MIADEIKNKILSHIEKHFSEEEVSIASSKFLIEIPDSPEKGDLTCNIALILGNITKNNPKEIGLEIGNILKELNLVSFIEIAGPGFINIFLNHSGTLKIIKDILDKNTIREEEDSKKIQVEFVSANPTGPLHVGHGRGAIYGDVISRLLEKKGHEVQKEYYVNDAGRQIDILTASVFLRILNIEDNIFPKSAYKGEYIKVIARDAINNSWKDESPFHKYFNFESPLDVSVLFEKLPEDEEKKIDKIISYIKSKHKKEWYFVKNHAVSNVLSGIAVSLNDFGVRFDDYFLESQLLTSDSKVDHKGQIESGSKLDAAIKQLDKNNLLDNRDGNIWFKSSDFGDDKDRVLIRADGRQTYFASDVAYHKDKLERGFDEIINIWGSDHHGYIKRVEASLEGLGYEKNKLSVKLVQFANLIKSGSPVKMSTRSGEFYSLEDLLNDVGSDVARFYYLSKQTDQHLDFDLDLAVSSKKENMYYYIQYAHARICSLEKKAGLKDFLAENISEDHVSICSNLIHEISKYPNVLEKTCNNLSPHLLIFYLKDLASAFHNFYNDNKILDKSESEKLTILAVTHTVKEVIADSLNLLGVKALKEM